MQRGAGRIAAACTAMALATVLLAAAPTSSSGGTLTVAAGAGKHAPQPLRATIRRTRYGIPHIRSDSIEGVAAGFGYAYAADNICTIASEYVTVAGKRSKYFGPNAGWTFSGNGTTYDLSLIHI